MDERRRDRRREAVAHRAAGRTEERPGPAEAKATSGPATEVAGIERDDRVVGQDAPQGRNGPARMDAGTRPIATVDDACLLPRRAVGRVRGAALLDERGVEDRAAQPQVGGAQKRAG